MYHNVDDEDDDDEDHVADDDVEDYDVEDEDDEVEEDDRSQDRGRHFCKRVQSKCRRTFHKGHFVREFTGKMPQTKTGDHTLCEPAQSKCTRTFHNLVVPSDPLAIYSRPHTCIYIYMQYA